MSNKHFEKMVQNGNLVGEVAAVDKFAVKVKGLHPINLHALIMFEDGSKGFVKEIGVNYVSILHLGDTPVAVGDVCVAQYSKLVSKVGKNFIGRVISVSGKPLDGKGPIMPDSVWPVFNEAPPIYARKLLETQLESGVVGIDSLFPVVRGQRIAILGDSKSGKTTLATQLTINQKNTDQVVVYCLIAKRKSDVDTLINKLEQTGALKKAVVVVSTVFESIVNTYLAPYVACSIAEFLWQKCNQDTIIIYDDLTSHAYAHREISLLFGVSPGRDSYPGDMFYAHSSLLERAGRLDATGASLTSIPVVLASNGDITAYLPTNIMSITDGQWILDTEIFKSGVRPALNAGLSVTRVGGVGHNKRQKSLASKTLKLLAEYRQALEFSRFGSEMALESKAIIEKGKNIQNILTQSPTEVYSLIKQQLLLDLVLNSKEGERVDVNRLRVKLDKVNDDIKDDKDYELEKAKLA